MKKYYFIDENGNKKQYMGKVISDYVTGNTYGILSYQEVEEQQVDLQFHNEVLHQPFKPAYFTYIDNNGEEKIYTNLKNNINKNNEDNSYFFNQTITEKVDLKYYPKIEKIPKRFTYIDNGEEVEYTGKYFYNKFTSTYYFYKE